MRVSVSLFRPRYKRDGETRICKIWHAAWRDPQSGRRCTRSTGTSNRQAAQLFATKLQDRLYRQSIGAFDPAEDHVDLLFTDARDRFLAAQRRRLRPGSVDAYRYSLLAFDRIIKPQEVRKIDRRTVHEFVSRRSGQVGAATTNKDLRQLRTFLNWCKRQGYLAVAPDFRGQFLRVDEAEPTWVADNDVKAVMKALDDPELALSKRPAKWWGVFIRTALFTGMRRSELLGLRWSEVDFETGTVRVIRYTSKGRRDRLYEGAHALTEMLRHWRDSQPEAPKPSDAVLPYERNPRCLYEDWDRILERAGIPIERRFTPHDCRSSCVSELLAQGVALTTVRDWVGHSSVGVTERYYAATRSDRRRVASERKIV